jgi:hypothetical protein
MADKPAATLKVDILSEGMIMLYTPSTPSAIALSDIFGGKLVIIVASTLAKNVHELLFSLDR